ncbi:hypothetical protein [Chlorogloea sp. CCALA 695]|uniref:hypothetical protein n=1 Tax=Chlorogloea sp. CCALA 695 TaxID=2107693 RepID=UPI000D05A138|nr:hypothetical protein [Chlorogloea sp. CCALA 695]PSB34623.1 hypothetical protein C7B70_03985 [Chlorogloea sp. CCALA 695]
MLRKSVLWSVWVGFIAYVLLLAPPLHLPETIALLINILTFQWGEVNAIILSIFALVGVWLLIYSCLLFIDGRMQKIPFWVFALASVGSGVIGLIPYLALREPNQEFTGKKDKFLNLLDSRSTGIILTVFTIFVLVYGVFAGNWTDYIQQFLGDRFINGMSLAFCLFCLLFPIVLGDDMARRGWLRDSQLFWVIALIPLFGPLLYLCLRPPLIESTS